ncbi:MAG: flagellin [Oscillospiraceae bacterium]|jgi:flagellin|nr:flagellin [Oscillospiraceae bacterium]
MRIQNNVTAQNSHRQYNINTLNIGKNVEKLSSGYRVNRAADDAAGLAISEKMRTQIRGLNMASRNSQDGISLVQTAEGALQAAHSMLQRMRELAVQAANGTNDSMVDRPALQLEFAQLNQELDQISGTVKFNDQQIFGMPFTLQTGANAGDITTFSVQSLSFTGLGQIDEDSAADVPGANASTAISNLTDAINELSMNRATLGAIQNRLEFKIQNLDNSAENLAAAESRIRDADMAKMMTEFTKNNILFQSSTAMLAQANALPQGVLQLLG